MHTELITRRSVSERPRPREAHDVEHQGYAPPLSQTRHVRLRQALHPLQLAQVNATHRLSAAASLQGYFRAGYTKHTEQSDDILILVGSGARVI